MSPSNLVVFVRPLGVGPESRPTFVYATRVSLARVVERFPHQGRGVIGSLRVFRRSDSERSLRGDVDGVVANLELGNNVGLSAGHVGILIKQGV